METNKQLRTTADKLKQNEISKIQYTMEKINSSEEYVKYIIESYCNTIEELFNKIKKQSCDNCYYFNTNNVKNHCPECSKQYYNNFKPMENN
jgi:uncharacterized paraquat-inducible protein A